MLVENVCGRKASDSQNTRTKKKEEKPDGNDTSVMSQVVYRFSKFREKHLKMDKDN